MTPRFFDSHTHIQFSAYDTDRDDVIRRSLDAGIWMINSGSNSSNSMDAVRLAEKYEKGVYATAGIHPSHAGHENTDIGEDFGTEEFDEEKMLELASSPKVVGIGECGLEYFREYDLDSQKDLFARHIVFAAKIKKPLVIHCREAYQDTYDILLSHKNELHERGGLMHFFSGTLEEAKKFLDLGFFFSFGGALTFPKKPTGADFAALVRELPLDKIMFETDAPYVSPTPHRGERNEPLYMMEVVKKAAEIRNMSPEKMGLTGALNTCRLFAIEPERD